MGVFVYQASIEQAPSHPHENTLFPFIWYKIPSDAMTSVSDECGQRQDERTALISDANESDCADDKGQDDVLCDLLSRHRNDVDPKVFKDADEAINVVGVQQLAAAEMQNSWDQVTDSSITLKNPGECDVCYKQFTERSHLKRHMLTHTGERPHKCDVCYKQFTKRSDLKTHMLTHSGERPHKCDVCYKKFT